MSAEHPASKERMQEAKAALAKARELMERRYQGIDEREAITYARGFMRGLRAAGKSEQESRDIAFACAIEDKLLDAGGAYMGHAIIEATVSEQQ
jgi:hypothetical protein